MLSSYFLIALENCRRKQLDHGHVFLESHVAYLGSDFEDDELYVHFPKDLIFVPLDNFPLGLFINDSFSVFLPVLFEALLVHGGENLVGRPLLSIEGANVPDQKLKYLCHVLFATHNQIYFSITHIQSDAVPTKEGCILHIVFRHAYNMFS